MQTVGELPLGNVVTIAPESTLDAALAALLPTDAAELYVTDADHRLIGIVPDYELLRARLGGVADSTSVERIMSAQVACYTTQTPVESVLAEFRSGSRTRAAVVKDGRLIGQITRSGVLRALCTPQPPCVPRPKFCNSELARNALTLQSIGAI